MADGPALEISVNKTNYLIRFEDFNALEAREFRREMGSGMAAAFTDTPDLDTIAALLWLHRRKTNPKLKFDDVAKELTYVNFDVGGSDDEPEKAGPEEDDPEI
jgi:hypothetical protein